MSWFKPVARPDKAALDAATVELAKAQQEGKSALKRLLHVLDVPADEALSALGAHLMGRERK